MTAEQILQELQQPSPEPAEETAESQPVLDQEADNLEGDIPENNPETLETPEHDSEPLEPIVDSSPTVGLKQEPDFERETEAAPASSEGPASVEPSASDLAAARDAALVHVQFLSQEGGDEEEAVGSVECEVVRPRGPDNSSKVGNVILISSQSGCTERRQGCGFLTRYEAADSDSSGLSGCSERFDGTALLIRSWFILPTLSVRIAIGCFLTVTGGDRV